MPPGRRRKEAAELPAERPEEPPVEDEDADKEPRPPSVLTAGEREEIARSDLLNMPIPERPVPAMSAGPGGERLMITKIVVENFKSYFGREILGPFHKNFTSILGPNGSGKSNVIDSLLFVFGFRANRIRSKKVSSLIHSSAAHPNVASCKVEVFFGKIVDKGDHDFEVRPGSEFSVSRTATKSGQSAYQVNGRTATTGEVRERLRANGIDLDHNRFLILQGEVEQIALMKPKGCERSGVDGMLEYLEDIIGSSRLKEPIEKLKKKLEWFNNEEDMVQKRVDLALSEVEQMAEPVLQVLRMITVENAITDCTHKLLSIRKCELGQRQREGGERFTKAKEELREARTELNKCEEDFKNETAVKTEMLKNSDKLKDRIRKAEEAERDVEVNAKKTADRVKSLEKKIASKEAEIEREEEKLQEARDAPARARQLIEEQTATIETRTEQIAELEEELRELRKKKRDANAATRRQLEEIMPRIGVMNEEEAKCEGNVALAKDKLERMQSASTNFEQKYVEAENRFRKVQEDHELSKRELAAQEQQIPQLRAEVASGEAEVRGIREQEHALVQKFNGLNSELQVARAQADGNRTQNAALAALNQEHVKGRLGGLLGRLGDLGGIDERYDVAISTCCPQLETVAVETVECAQECIEFLKARNMPRMTFIALDKQQHLWPRIENKPQTPEDQPRLIDLIQVSDRRLLPAFYSALHDTLVVDTIERASRVSNHEGRRWRVVTLRGEVVETSGTMSGGGRQEKRGAMGKRARVDTSQRTPAVDLREMERQLGEKREQLNRLRSQLEAKNSELQTRKDDLAQAVHNQRLISQRISVFKKQLEEASNQMARAKTAFESLDVDEDAICALRDEMNRFEREKESVCQRASELRKTKEKLEAEIKKVEDRVLGKAQSQLKKWKSELKAAEDTLCRETLVLKNSAATIQRIETTIRRAKDGIEEAEGDVRRATEQLERQRQDVQTRAEEKVALAEQLEELQAAIVRKTEEIAALVQREEEARRPLQDKEKEVEEASREVEKLLKKVQKVDEDIGKLSVIQVRQDMLPFLYDAMAKRGRGAQNEETASNRSPNQREGSANSTPASSQQTQEGEEDAPANEQQAEAERMEPRVDVRTPSQSPLAKRHRSNEHEERWD
ncbi:SMC family domain-containing protein [Aphelenchoides fujianensis]|nr:SMC family domain-containing protein [Aphelenchoides fujianensis]